MITMNVISKRQCARLYINKNPKKYKTFLYTKSQTVFKKQKQIHTFLFPKSQTLYVMQFLMKVLKLAFYTKSMTLCVT